MRKRRWHSPWGLNFFGLKAGEKEIFLEPIFLLMYYGGFTYSEAYNIPAAYRNWFVKRIEREVIREEGAPTRALHQNDPSVRNLMGMTRNEGPSRLRRFS